MKYASVINIAIKVLRKTKNTLAKQRVEVVKKYIQILPAKKHRIFDCFLFNDELDILKLRLSKLYDYVDYFFIFESPTTFSGIPKTLYFQENTSLFAQYEDKIRHIIIPESPTSTLDSNPLNPVAQTSEFYQRNQIASVLKDALDSDLILVSDVDEIPNPDVFENLYKLCYYANATVYLSQVWCLLFLNIQVSGLDDIVFKTEQGKDTYPNNRWLGTFACTAKKLMPCNSTSINGIWGNKWGSGRLDDPIMDNAGWHFSYMGGFPTLASKIKASGSNTPMSQRTVSDIRSGKFIGCHLRIMDVESEYLKGILKNPESWSHLLLKDLSFQELASRLEDYLSTNS